MVCQAAISAVDELLFSSDTPSINILRSIHVVTSFYQVLNKKCYISLVLPLMSTEIKAIYSAHPVFVIGSGHLVDVKGIPTKKQNLMGDIRKIAPVLMVLYLRKLVSKELLFYYKLAEWIILPWVF